MRMSDWAASMRLPPSSIARALASAAGIAQNSPAVRAFAVVLWAA